MFMRDLSVIYCIQLLGCPVRATPNQELPSIYIKKDEMVNGTPRRLYVSYLFFSWADFWEGTGHFRMSGKQTLKSIWQEHKIIVWGQNISRSISRSLRPTGSIPKIILCLWGFLCIRDTRRRGNKITAFPLEE